MLTPEATSLIRIYNRLVPLVVGRTRPRQIQIGVANAELAKKLHDWLDERSITVGVYLCSCFAKHSWGYKPPLKKLTAPAYEKFFEENRSDAYLWWAAIERERVSTEVVQLPVGKEIVKKRLLADGGPGMCLPRAHLTGGFNPVSRLCRGCAMQEACREHNSKL